MRFVLAWLVLTTPGLFAALPSSAAGPTLSDALPSYPESIYPLRSNQIPRLSEVPFVESAESRQHGYDVPFPSVARTIVNVENFGARADGRTDCTMAFYRALASVTNAARPAEIFFPSKGRYYFGPNTNAGSDTLAILNVRHATNLLIRGQGHDTTLVMGDPALGGLNIVESDTVMVRDFAIDYNPLPFTQGTVTAVDAAAGTFVLRVHDGYPTPAFINAAIPGHHSGFRVERSARGSFRWPNIMGLSIRKVEPAESGEWRFHTDPKALSGYLEKGRDFIYVGRRVSQKALGARNSRSFHVQGVTVHASPTCGLGLSSVDGASVDGYADTIPEGSNRLLATDADGIFCHGVRGGLTVKNSYFMGQGDDCINLHCQAWTPRYVTMPGDRLLAMQRDPGFRPNDLLEIMNPVTHKLKGQIAVASVTRNAEGTDWRVSLAGSLHALGYDPTTDYVYSPSWAVPNFKIVHNYFGQNRSRCLFIQARHGLIEANTFENAEGYGVLLSYGSTAWPEGVIPSDVVIRSNLFRNVTGFGLAAVIEASVPSAARYLQRLRVEENRFINPRKLTMNFDGCADVLIRGNTVSTEAGWRNTWNHPQYYPVDCSISLNNCSGVVLDSYRLTDPKIREAAIYIGQTCEAGTNGVLVKDLQAQLPPNMPKIKDARAAGR